MIGNYRKEKAGLFWLLIWLVSSTCPFWGQVNPKKVLTEDDYRLWGKLSMDKMNSPGSWMSWRMRYEDGRDLLYVGRTTAKSDSKVFNKVSKNDFLGSDRFGYLDASATLRVIDLQTGRDWEKPNVAFYDYFDDFGLLLVQSKGDSGLSDVEIITYAGESKLKIRNVFALNVDFQKKKVAITIKEEASYYCVILSIQNLVLDRVAAYCREGLQTPVWDNSGRFVAFATASTANEALYLFDCNLKKLSTFKTETDRLLKDWSLGQGWGLGLTIRDDGEGVFFNMVKARVPMYKNPVVEVWNSSDPLVYPAQKLMDSTPESLMMYWNVKTNKITSVADSELPQSALTGKKDYAITWNNLAYEPQFERDGPADYHVTDIRTGVKSKWLIKAGDGAISPLINSNRILYIDGGWKLYNPETGRVLNIEIPIDEVTSARFKTALQPASDLTGTWLLVPDGCDIWKVNIETGQRHRLTFGREKGLIYALPQKSMRRMDGNGLLFIRSFDLSKPLPLKVQEKNGIRNGIAILQPGGKLQPVDFTAIGHSDALTNSDHTILGFITESFAQPAKLQIYRKGNITTVFESNTHQAQFVWGRAELVSYKVGAYELKGILYCPDKIEREKKYPLITHIYEIQSDKLYQSILPSYYNFTGFNIANLVAKGYFVFLPDIKHGLGNPGKDAEVSVTAAIDKVVANYPIDETKLGLIGRSFGGYETAAIVGYTNRFAAAVMGCGVAMAPTLYLHVNQNTLKPDYWRYETDQFRIGKSLFEDKQAFIESSPAFFADKIETSLLIWSGAEDQQVPVDQSYNMHLAMRRLGKKSTLLVYPNEGHSLLKPDSNKDLTQRIEQWFDHFLKGEPVSWIK